ncbi:MAG: metallophosphoesterase [Lachnospiraceae bacterium]|nr:metallophosphoesterase [Ruminococcus sp.]MCM1275303.1 metallophosphoesterase [Lachnospiraceae bacterium]
MKILVVSDTHRNYAALEDIVRKNPDADMLVHLGDGEREFAELGKAFPQLPMVYVGGNCDYGAHEQTHIVQAGGMKIFCCHGHNHAVNGGVGLLVATAIMNGCKTALYGHTHVRFAEEVGGVFVMNPGSPSEPRGGNPPSYGVIRLTDNGQIETDIITLER